MFLAERGLWQLSLSPSTCNGNSCGCRAPRRRPCRLQFVFPFHLPFGSNLPDTYLCTASRVTIGKTLFWTESLFLRWAGRRRLADSISKIKAQSEEQQQSCFMQTRDWKWSGKSEMCSFASFRLKAFPTCSPAVDTSEGTSNPRCDTSHLSPLQFAAAILSFIYSHLRIIADGRGQKTESLTCYLWFTILIPRELQRRRSSLFDLNIIIKYERWNVLLLSTLGHGWQMLLLWNNAAWVLTSAVWLKHWDALNPTPPPPI